MKVKILFLILIICSLSNFVLSQKPEQVLPGMTKTLSPTNDTLWILTNKDFKKTIIAKRELDICNKQIQVYEQMVDTLKVANAEYKSLVEVLTKDRDYYMTTWKDCESDLVLMGELNQKQTTYTKIAIYVGTVTTITAFIVGFFLGTK